jgi:UDP-GlcNAc:undecaprenyl-phosphate/decaprenyl-phosphate GlcNAc-1-phosphate transferase
MPGGLFSGAEMTLLAALSHLLFTLGVFLASAAMTWGMIRFNISDVPNARSSHVLPTPKSGGVAIAAAFFSGLVALYLLSGTARLPGTQFVMFLVTAGLMFAAALMDDLIGLRARTKFIMQFICALLFSLFVAHIDGLALPLIGNAAFGAFGHVLTVLWIIFFMNAFNFMDGINGLAGGGALIASVFLAAIAFFSGAHFVYLAALCLIGAVSGFFVFNFPNGRIFMGDTGSQIIGFAMAGLAVIGARADLGQISITVVPALFGVFLFDVVATLIYRFARGRNLGQAHREHLYQISNRLGFSHKRVSLIYFGLFIMNGVFGVLLQAADPAARLPLLLGGILLHAPLAVMVYGAGLRRGIADLERPVEIEAEIQTGA